MSKSYDKEKSIGIFEAIGMVFGAITRSTVSVCDGIAKYGEAFERSGDMLIDAVDNAREEQLLELEQTRQKRAKLVIEHKD